MLGKHFLVRTLQGRKPARHYTVCNVMHPAVYDSLIRLLQTNDGDTSVLKQRLSTED